MEIVVPPQVIYCHYVNINQISDVINWSFSTSKHTIAFGLFFRKFDPPKTSITSVTKSYDKKNSLTPSEKSTTPDSMLDFRDASSKSPSAFSQKLDIPRANSAISILKSAGLLKPNSKISTFQDGDSPSENTPLEPNTLPNKTFLKKSMLKNAITLIPIEMYKSSNASVTGSWVAENKGVYMLCFSNTFSLTKSKTLSLSVSVSSTNNENITNPNILISGWLMKKWRKRLQGWNKRWVWIQEDTLLYSNSSGGIIRGKVSIPNSVISVEHSNLLIIIDSDDGPMIFRAPDLKSFNAWSSALESVVSSDSFKPEQSPSNRLVDLSTIPLSRVSKAHEEFYEYLTETKSLVNKALSVAAFFEGAQVDQQEDDVMDPLSDINPSLNQSHINIGTGKDTKSKHHIHRIFSKIKRLSDPSSKPVDPSQMIANLQPTLNQIVDNIQKLALCEDFIFSSLEKCVGFDLKSREVDLDGLDDGYLSESIVGSKQRHVIGIEYDRDSLSDIFYDTSEVPHQEGGPGTPEDDYPCEDKLRTDKELDPIMFSEDDDAFEAYIAESTENDIESPFESARSLVRRNTAISIDEIGIRYKDIIDTQEPNEVHLIETEDTHLKESLLSIDQSVDPMPLTTLKLFSVSDVVERRTRLPANEPKEGVNIVSIFKKNIGKDLSKIRMPVEANEPLSALQALSEELECSYLLDKAAALPNSLDRLMCVVGFAMSSYIPSKFRVGYKPFNPMLGETFEIVRPDLGFRFVSEKVSHHPMVVACHADSPNYIFYQDCNVKSRFWGRTIELIRSSLIHVELPGVGDHYTFNKASTIIKGILSGNQSIEFNGRVEIKNHTTGDSADILFKESNMFSSSDDKFEGLIVSADKSIPPRKIYGKWSESVYCETEKGPVLVWDASKYKSGVGKDQFGFGVYATSLNELTVDLKNTPENREARKLDVLVREKTPDFLAALEAKEYLLPNTDSRLRPDMRLYENGDLDGANVVKNELETNQSKNLSKINESGGNWAPKWFELKTDPVNSEIKTWTYKGGYWKDALVQGFDQNPFFLTTDR
ncbi:hypothetical protein BB560_001653 [Smittium megazygosporum]|uniref:PH domain-containing protein n=1 Tax=Smittium megazygosporum TaxID=133381 RepID=A0A2T9ZGX4_9FUNG|nr:hypothetical protein BB560_001653 [Smittium megazygosporum]